MATPLTIEVRDLGGIHVLMLGDMILTQAMACQLDRSIFPLSDGINEHHDPGVVAHSSSSSHQSSDLAALRLAEITARGLAHEVSPGLYRVGPKVA